MGLSRTPVFCKRKTCPSSRMLLAYDQATLSYEARKQVAAHLVQCDFCGAEMQLLASHPPGLGECTQSPMPLHLRLLAERLLTNDHSSLENLFRADLQELDEVRV